MHQVTRSRHTTEENNSWHNIFPLLDGRRNAFQIEISLNNPTQGHELSGTFCNLTKITNEQCILNVKTLQEQRIIPLFLQIAYQLFLVANPDIHKLDIKAF
jgi:hypothetical protein